MPCEVCRVVLTIAAVVIRLCVTLVDTMLLYHVLCCAVGTSPDGLTYVVHRHWTNVNVT